MAEEKVNSFLSFDDNQFADLDIEGTLRKLSTDEKGEVEPVVVKPTEEEVVEKTPTAEIIDPKEVTKWPDLKTVIDPSKEEKEEEKKKEPSNYEKEEEKQEEKEKTTPKEEATEDDDVVKRFNQNVEMGFFHVPEGFEFDGTPEKFSEAMEHTRKHWAEEGEKELALRIKDPKVWELIDYGMKGGRFADLELFGKYQQIEDSYAQADVSDPEVAEIVYRNFLAEDSRLTQNQIEKLVSDAKENEQLSTEAARAKTWFVNEAKTRREAKQQEDYAKQQEAVERERQTVSKIRDVLADSKYQSGVKARILSSLEYQQVEGRQIQNWQAQLLEVRNNPQHFVQLLNLLSEYDPKEGFQFSEQKSETKKEVKSSLYDLFINGGEKSKATGGEKTTKTKQTAPPVMRDPFYTPRTLN